MGLYGVVLSIVGLIFSRIQQKNNPTKIGKAAWILNSISLALNIVLLVVYYAFILPQLTQMGISLE
jgi:predicted Co/Zn/Cd cation transporter (cation efflux family)